MKTKKDSSVNADKKSPVREAEKVKEPKVTMKILFTGKDGALSKNFVRSFKGIYEITRAGDIDYADLSAVCALFNEKSFDAIIHAVYDNADDIKLSASDLIAYRNVTYAAAAATVKKMLILTTPGDLYYGGDLVNVEEKVSEAYPSAEKPVNNYLLTSQALKTNFSTVLRFFSVYGEDVKSKDIFNKIINGGYSKRDSYNVEKDMIVSAVYVGDAVQIIARFLDNDYKRGSYNVVSTAAVNYFDAAKKAVAAAKKHGKEYNVKFKTLDNGIFTASSAKLMSVMPDFKFTSLSSAIAKTYEYEFKKEDIVN